MQKEYLGTINNRHSLTKYTLSNGIEVTLTTEELEELLLNTDLYLDMRAEVISLESDISYMDSEADKLREALDYEEDTNDSLRGEIDALKEELNKRGKNDKYK